MREQFGCQCAAGVGINCNRGDAATVRRVAGHAKHGSALTDDAADHGGELARAARSEQNAIVVFGRCAFQCSQIARTETRILNEVEGDLHAHGLLGSGANTLTERIEEGCDLAGKYSGDTNIAIKLERACSDVRLVTELFRHAQHARLCSGAHPASSVQCAVDGTDGGSEGLCDVANAGCFAALADSCHFVRCCQYSRANLACRKRWKMAKIDFDSETDQCVLLFTLTYTYRQLTSLQCLGASTFCDFCEGSGSSLRGQNA